MLINDRPSVEQKGTLEKPSIRAMYPPPTRFSHKSFVAPDGSLLAFATEHQINEYTSISEST